MSLNDWLLRVCYGLLSTTTALPMLAYDGSRPDEMIRSTVP